MFFRFNAAFLRNVRKDCRLCGIWFLSKTSRHNSHCRIVVQHPVFAHSWQEHVTPHQRTQNELLCVHCKMATRRRGAATISRYRYMACTANLQHRKKQRKAICTRSVFPFITLWRRYYPYCHCSFLQVFQHFKVILTFPPWSTPPPLLSFGHQTARCFMFHTL